MSGLVTICARGGSKGVKNKNIRKLLGKPLIAYTIEQALKWGVVDEVVVSTDSKAIADVALAYGALVPFVRPAHLAKDETPKFPVIRHALFECERVFNKKYDIVVDLDPTAPIRQVTDIENCYQKFLKERPKALFSVVRSHKSPYFNMVELNGDGYATLSKNLEKPVHRRQDSPQVFNMNASIYVYDRNYLIDEANISPLSDHSVAYVMSDISGFDIDREIDFKFVEFLLKEYKAGAL